MQNQIINMCRVLIGPNAVVTDDQINDTIARVSLIFPNMDIAQVKNELLSLYGVRIQDFQILEGNERRQPWLRDFKAERKSTWDFWVRYKQYLSEQKGFAPLVLDVLINRHKTVVLRDAPDSEATDDEDTKAEDNSYCDSPLREFHCLLTVLGRLRGVYPDKTTEVSEYLLLDVLYTKTVPRYTNCRTYLRCRPFSTGVR